MYMYIYTQENIYIHIGRMASTQKVRCLCLPCNTVSRKDIKKKHDVNIKHS